MRLWWRVNASIERDYSIGSYILDAGGALVAQTDAQLNNFGTETIPTSQLRPGPIYMDYRTIPLPPNLPPGDYQLALAVYQWEDQARLLLADGSDLLMLAQVALR